MANSSTFRHPKGNGAVPVDARVFSMAALSGADVWLAQNANGWFAIAASENIDSVLATARKTVRHFSSLDTAAKQLSKLGVTKAAIRLEAFHD